MGISTPVMQTIRLYPRIPFALAMGVCQRGSNILNIAGWSESIFDVINSKFCGYKNMIEEIKKIKI